MDHHSCPCLNGAPLAHHSPICCLPSVQSIDFIMKPEQISMSGDVLPPLTGKYFSFLMDCILLMEILHCFMVLT
jgi:hypothetical protein